MFSLNFMSQLTNISLESSQIQNIQRPRRRSTFSDSCRTTWRSWRSWPSLINADFRFFALPHTRLCWDSIRMFWSGLKFSWSTSILHFRLNQTYQQSEISQFTFSNQFLLISTSQIQLKSPHQVQQFSPHGNAHTICCHMIELDSNPRKKIKLTTTTSNSSAAIGSSSMADAEKMEIDGSSAAKKANFSSISASGPIVRGGNANAKGDVKKLVIKNFKGEFSTLFCVILISIISLQQQPTPFVMAAVNSELILISPPLQPSRVCPTTTRKTPGRSWRRPSSQFKHRRRLFTVSRSSIRRWRTCAVTRWTRISTWISPDSPRDMWRRTLSLSWRSESINWWEIRKFCCAQHISWLRSSSSSSSIWRKSTSAGNRTANRWSWFEVYFYI